MKKKKTDYTWVFWIIGILIIIWSINNLKLNINVPLQNQTLSITPNQQTPTISTCYQLCYQNGFSQSYSSTTCKPGETYAVYGYPNQPPILTCCCYNTPIESNTCSDPDGKDSRTPATTTFNGMGYMDKCIDEHSLTEYYCQNNKLETLTFVCALGETCLSSRSGGYCKYVGKTWNPGDTVAEGSGSGTLIGTDSAYAELNLNDYGLTAGGNCRLGVQIQTSWNYASPECSGLHGFEGVEWQFWDSAGLEYARVDTSPVSLGVDLNPGNGHNLEWDGITPWKGKLIKMLNIPGCIITDNWSVRVYIYDCT